MPVYQPPNIYQEQLSSEYHGLALWDPNPVQGLFNNPGHVSIGDVGYLDNGAFMRIFNIKLARDDPSNNFIEIPEGYKPLGQEHFDHVRHSKIRQEEYNSHISKVDNVRSLDDGKTYVCKAQSHGALLSLPHGARSKDVIRVKLFEDYIRDNVDSWLRWSKKEGLPVGNTEDLILVTGFTLATSWAAAAFDGTMSRDEDDSTISLKVLKLDGGGAQFFWSNIRGSVEYNHSDSPENIEEPGNQCVFIRGLRAKRVQFGIKVIRIGRGRDDENPQRSQYQNDGLRNPSSSLRGDSHLAGSSVEMIRPPINHENSQLLPYPSSTALVQSNGSLYDASFMTSPSDNSFLEVPNDVAEARPSGSPSHGRSNPYASAGLGPGFPVLQPYRQLSAKERQLVRPNYEMGGLRLASVLEEGEDDIIQHSDGGRITEPVPPSRQLQEIPPSYESVPGPW